MLICIGGRGWYQEYGKEPTELDPGDIVNIPAEVKHWHGAAKKSWFAHLAIEIPGEDGSTEWCEPVSDDDEKCCVILDDKTIHFMFFNQEIEYVLSEEIEFECRIKASNAELAAYCLNDIIDFPVESSFPIDKQYVIKLHQGA